MPFDGTTYKIPVYHLLEDARQRIDRGWCQHRPRTSDGVCAIAALADAAAGLGPYSNYAEAHKYLLAAVKESGFAQGGVSEFNDSHTKDEVLAVYDRAVDLAAVGPVSAG